jgi:hypothetical protein
MEIGRYTLRRVHPTTLGCRFEFHQDCDIYIELDGPFRAELRDVGELMAVRGRMASWIWGSAGSALLKIDSACA